MPSFFLTISLADMKNPLCLVMCGVEVDLASHVPALPGEWDQMMAIANNPVSLAEFFHHLVYGILAHVLCVDGHNIVGVLGPVSTYYSTVEEQG